VLLVGHIEAMAIGHVLPDGRELFADVRFHVGEGARVALVALSLAPPPVRGGR